MAKRPKGRPKGAGRIQLRCSFVTSPKYREWIDRFQKHLGGVDLSEVIRNALRRYAESEGFEPPPWR